MSWLTAGDCDLDEFRSLVEVSMDRTDYPYAESVEQGVPVYGPGPTRHTATAESRRKVQAELASGLLGGPGLVVFGPHRDYHLGFLSLDRAAAHPAGDRTAIRTAVFPALRKLNAWCGRCSAQHRPAYAGAACAGRTPVRRLMVL